ncbi:MAG: hypothetical protein ABI652_04045 [Acidobacteriota bacterium]
MVSVKEEVSAPKNDRLPPLCALSLAQRLGTSIVITLAVDESNAGPVPGMTADDFYVLARRAGHFARIAEPALAEVSS